MCKVNNLNEIEFNKNYGDSVNDEQVFYVINTYDKGFLIVGQSVVPASVSADMYAVKVDSAGNFEWDKYYGGSNFEGASSVIQTPDSGYLVLGFTQSFGPNTKWYLVKTDKYGNQEWDKRYSSNDNQSGWGITKLNDGNYLMAGGGSDGNARIIKINPTGDIIWQRTYSNPNSEANYFYWARELPDKSIVAVGGTNNMTEIDAGWIVKIDSVGTKLWERKYNKTENVDLFYDFIKTDDGGFLLAGLAWNTSSSSQDAWLLRVDSLGCAYEDCTVGIDDEGIKVLVDVYPNPAGEVLNLELQEVRKVYEVELTDINGQVVYKSEIRNHKSEIAVSGFANGIYLLTLQNEEERVTVKVVVQH